jgi:hypothetical protein
MPSREAAMAAVVLLETESRLAQQLARKVSLLCAAQGVRALMDQKGSVYLVVGRVIGEGGASWVHGAWWDGKVAAGKAERLNAAAKAAGVVHGKSDLIGLEVDERRSVKQMLIGQDSLVEVGRHGVEWTVVRQAVS